MWKEEGGGVEVVCFAFLAWMESGEREGFEDVAYTGLHSATHPRPSICQGASSVSGDVGICY